MTWSPQRPGRSVRRHLNARPLTIHKGQRRQPLRQISLSTVRLRSIRFFLIRNETHLPALIRRTVKPELSSSDAPFSCRFEWNPECFG